MRCGYTLHVSAGMQIYGVIDEYQRQRSAEPWTTAELAGVPGLQHVYFHNLSSRLLHFLLDQCIHELPSLLSPPLS